MGRATSRFPPAGDMLLYTPWDASTLRTVALDGSETRLSSSESSASQYEQITVDGNGDVWAYGRDGIATTISITDDEVEVMQLPPSVIDWGGASGDPGGGLIAYVSGDVFEVNSSGSTRITTGEIVALGARYSDRQRMR